MIQQVENTYDEKKSPPTIASSMQFRRLGSCQAVIARWTSAAREIKTAEYFSQ
jgi:hypothetical protein